MVKEDLKLFNDIVEEFLKDELQNPVTKQYSPRELKSKIDLKLKDTPTPSADYKKTLKNIVLNTPKSSSNKFFNQLYGGRNSKAVLGDLLAVLLNNSMATYKIAGIQVCIEKEVIRKVCKITGYNKNSGGTFPTGGSMSNFMSLIMARDKVDLSIQNDGNQEKLIAYASREAHYSLLKNMSFSGIGKKNIRYVTTNNKGQIDVGFLKKQIELDLKEGLKPFYINLTAGTTVICAFDPILEIIEICKKHNIWVHLDGAFGGTVIFSEKYNHLVNGISQTDSFCFNAHKTLGTPLSTSVLVVKNKQHLYNSFNNSASYLYQTHNNEYNLGQTSFECGRRNNALKLWSMWKSIGTKGIAKIIDHEFFLAEYARKYVAEHEDYTLYNFENALSVCFNYKNYDPKEICLKLYEKNELMVGYGKFKNSRFIRLVLVNNNNTKKEVLNFFYTLENFVKKNSKQLKK